MAAIRVSLASSLTLIASTLYSSSSSLFSTKLRSTPVLGLSFSIIPSSFCSRRGKRMAHSIARATLGLTHPAQIDALKFSFAAKENDLAEWKGDILAVGVLEKDIAKDENSKFHNSILQKLDSQFGGLLSEASSEEDFAGKVGQLTILRLPGLGSKRVGLIGLGQGLLASYHGLGEAVAAAAKVSQANNVAIALASSEELSAESMLNTASAITTGTLMGTFEDSRFKSESKKPTLKSVDILGLGTGPELEKKLKYAEYVNFGERAC